MYLYEDRKPKPHSSHTWDTASPMLKAQSHILQAPELALAFELARPSPQCLHLECIHELCKQCTDVTKFVSYCTENAVHYLALRNIMYLNPDTQEFAMEASQQFQRYLSNREKQLRRLSVTAKCIHKAFDRLSIKYCFIRGFVLAHPYYAFPQDRYFADIDVLITPDTVSRARSILEQSGFEYCESVVQQQARANYMSQLELRHRHTHVRLDLNWSLTGNGGIGHISAVMADVWSNAERVGRNKYRLCHEDAVADIIRHYTHGHDFASGLVKAWCDVYAILRFTGGALNVEYLNNQLQHAQCQRASYFVLENMRRYFLHRDEHYLLDNIERFYQIQPDVRHFGRACMVSHVLLASQKSDPRVAWLRANIGAAAKLWAMDSLHHACCFLFRLLLPTDSALAMAVQCRKIAHSGVVSDYLKYFQRVANVSPGLAAGIVLRTLVPFLRVITLVKKWLN